MSTTYWITIVVLGSIWGTSFFFVEIALGGGYGPFTIVFGRTLLGAVVMLVFLVARGHSLRFLWDYRYPLLVAGFLNFALPFTLFAWGQKYVDSSVAALGNAATPFGTLALALAVKDERFRLASAIALCLGFGGVAWLVGPTFGYETLILLGTLACFLAAISYSVVIVYVHKKLSDYDSFYLAAGTMTFATLMTLPLAFALEVPWAVAFQWNAVLGLVALGVVCTGLAFMLFYGVIRRYGATNSTMVTFISPIVAFTLGFFVLGERLGWEFYVGGGLIILALLILDGHVNHFVRVTLRNIQNKLRHPPDGV